jgi:pimeloyl-ACP methyl ester carboxylesterase
MKQLIVFLTCLYLLSGCRKGKTEIFENLRLRYKGADMPVWVRGNGSSDRIVLFLHGGPGECAMCLRKYFMSAENQLIMAYWDQRMSGSSGGMADPSQLNYPQFADDLKQLVLLLKKLFPDKKIFLLGHSFGVEMGWQFLTTENNQSLVDGFIVTNGTYSTYDWLVNLRQWIIEKSIEKNDEKAFEYMNKINLTKENMASTVKWGDWYEIIFRLGGNPIWPSDDQGYNSNLWFFSPHSRFSQMVNTSSYGGYYTNEIFKFDRKDLLKNIAVPITIFWGEKDGIMPLSMANNTSDLLMNKPKPILFKDSWHSPFHTENNLFTEELIKATK